MSAFTPPFRKTVSDEIGEQIEDHGLTVVINGGFRLAEGEKKFSPN